MQELWKKGSSGENLPQTDRQAQSLDKFGTRRPKSGGSGFRIEPVLSLRATYTTPCEVKTNLLLLPVLFQTPRGDVHANALIDSGANSNFMSNAFAAKYQFERERIRSPRSLDVFTGTSNEIIEFCTAKLIMSCNDRMHMEALRF